MALIPVSLIGNKALAKVTIIPFKNSGSAVPAGPPFVAMYNPAGFTTQRGQELVPKYKTDGTEGQLESKNLQNSTISLDIFLDATGASPAGGVIGAALSKAAKVAQGVDILVAAFFSTTNEIKGDEHAPRFLRIVWGAGLFFEGRLQNASVKYDIIDSDGRPLRATISATFLQDPSPSFIAKIKNFFSSPDLTKTYLVKAGDTIYNIAKNEYEDESYYLQIAQANDLKNYRRLKPGMQLILPPIKKDE